MPDGGSPDGDGSTPPGRTPARGDSALADAAAAMLAGAAGWLAVLLAGPALGARPASWLGGPLAAMAATTLAVGVPAFVALRVTGRSVTGRALRAANALLLGGVVTGFALVLWLVAGPPGAVPPWLRSPEGVLAAVAAGGGGVGGVLFAVLERAGARR